MSDLITTLEQNARFSESLLWQYQRDYFARKGVVAWETVEVPYYVTSNVLIAYSFAQITLRYLQDGLANGFIDPAHPVYLFELGTGSGKFSFLFMKHFFELLKHFHLDHLKFCYVMTDFTESNMLFWQQQPRFKEFLAKGWLDFAIYRIGEKQDIKLVNQNITLGDGSLKNPFIAVGNYIFDTVPHDLFRITAGKLEEGLITTKTPADNVAGDSVHSLDRLQTDFSFAEINTPYYHREELDNILTDYLHQMAESTFLVPTGGIASIDNLRRLSNDRLLFITSDKGYSSTASLKQLGTPHIAFHGSFSMMVNFDFVGRYFKNLGGDCLLAEDHEGMKTSVFCLGQKFSDLPNTSWANYIFTTHISTKEFLEIKNFLINDTSLLDLDHILSLLKFSYWDPDIFYSISTRLASIVNQATPGYLDTLKPGLKAIEDNFYFIRSYKNVPFELGHVYHVIGDLDEALRLYQTSLDFFGKESPVFFNSGLCYYYKHDLKKALEYFQKAYATNPDNKSAKEWIGHVEKELTASAS